MTTETPTKTAVRKKAPISKTEAPHVDANDGKEAESEQEVAVSSSEKPDEGIEALEALEPYFERKDEPRRWIIGKPPERGGREDEYSVYVQRPLSHMARLRFFSLVGRTMAEAIKQGGSIDLGGSDAFNSGEEISIAQRVQRLREQDFSSAGNFMVLAMNLLSYSPNFMIECYLLWLDVPADERRWARMVMNQAYRPEDDQWGLSEDDAMEMVEIFIDQNYEDIRRFFAEKLPQIAKRVQQREDERKGRASGSVPSKQ